jgi:hypothetical protein
MQGMYKGNRKGRIQEKDCGSKRKKETGEAIVVKGKKRKDYRI